MKQSVTKELFEFDKKFLPEVFGGVDEVGRGPLAGPVVCACCIMPYGDYIDEINDSKKVTAKKRAELYGKIIKAARYSVQFVSEKVIDEINILNATKLAMKLSIDALSADLILVDAVKGLNVKPQVRSIIRGDATSYCIAAASILAKVERDRYMVEADALYPEYDFKNNKGYGTARHIEAIKKFGPCAIHRKSFIKNFIGG